MTSTVKAPETYSKSALLEIYAQKTEAPWVKRASSRKYSVRRHSRAAPCRTARCPAPRHPTLPLPPSTPRLPHPDRCRWRRCVPRCQSWRRRPRRVASTLRWPSVFEVALEVTHALISPHAHTHVSTQGVSTRGSWVN